MEMLDKEIEKLKAFIKQKEQEVSKETLRLENPGIS